MAIGDAINAATGTTTAYTGNPVVDDMIRRYRNGDIGKDQVAEWFGNNLDYAHLVDDASAFMTEDGALQHLEKMAGGPPDKAPWDKHNYSGVNASYRPELDYMRGQSAEERAAWANQQAGRGHQMEAMRALADYASGRQSAVRPELAAARDRIARQSMSQVASARGANRLAALRGGMYASGDAQAQLGSQGASALAQERLGALGAYGQAANSLRGGDLSAFGAAQRGDAARKGAYQGMFNAGNADKAFQAGLEVDYADKVAGQKQRNAELVFQSESDMDSGPGLGERIGLGLLNAGTMGLANMVTGSDIRSKWGAEPAPGVASGLITPFHGEPQGNPQGNPYDQLGGEMGPPKAGHELRELGEWHAAAEPGGGYNDAELYKHDTGPDQSGMHKEKPFDWSALGGLVGGLGGAVTGALRDRPRRQNRGLDAMLSNSPAQGFRIFSDERAKKNAFRAGASHAMTRFSNVPPDQVDHLVDLLSAMPDKNMAAQLHDEGSAGQPPPAGRMRIRRTDDHGQRIMESFPFGSEAATEQLRRLGSRAEVVLPRPGAQPQPPPADSDPAVRQFLDAIEPYTYQYKSPAYGPPGQHVGVMAQDMEKSPLGATAITHDPLTGMKQIDVPRATSLSLAGIADLANRVARLEGGSHGQ